MRKEAIEVGLEKDGLNLTIRLKVAEEIENYFRDVAHGQTETSDKWLDTNGSGLRFYAKNETMSRKVGSQQVMDNFGNGLFDYETDRINVALIRTVGASKGIVIKANGLLSYAEMEQYVRELAIWVKGFYENQLRPSQISAKISLDV